MQEQKIFAQLMEAALYGGVRQQDALTVILQLLCWRELSQMPDSLPDELRFDAVYQLSTRSLWDVLLELQQCKPQLFQDDSAWRQMREPRVLLERIWDCQRFMEGLKLDDAGFWAADRLSGCSAIAPGLAEFLLGLLQIKPDQQVYVPWENSGQISTRVARSGAALWVEACRPSFLAELLTLTETNNWTLCVSDPVQSPSALEGGKLRTFDAAVCFPPMGLRYPLEVCEHDLLGRFPEKTVSGVVLHIRHLLAQTHGRIVIAVNNAMLFGSGSERQVREYLISSGYLHAVIGLPRGLCTNTSIPISVLILDTSRRAERVRFVNATADEFIELKPNKHNDLSQLDRLLQLVNSSENCDVAVSATLADITANDFTLEVGRYVLDDSARRLQDNLSRYPLCELGDFFEVIRPRQHSTAGAGVAVSELQISDLPLYGYISQASKESLFDLRSPKSDLYFLQRGDVVVTFKGAIGKIGIIGDSPDTGEGGWLAGQTQAVLRCHQPQLFPPEALVVYLRSDMGQALLASKVVSTTVATIKLSELKQLKIPIPEAVELQRMADCFRQQNQIEQEIQRLRVRQAEIAAEFWAI